MFYYPLSPATGFHFMINCYFLYNYSLKLETGRKLQNRICHCLHFKCKTSQSIAANLSVSGVFDGRPADYCFMLLYNWICCVIVGLIVEIPVSCSLLLLATNTCILFLKLIKTYLTVFNGSHGAECVVRLVPTEQECHCKLLVWYPIQSHVPSLGTFCL